MPEIHRVGLRWNARSGQALTSVPPSLLSINCIAGAAWDEYRAVTIKAYYAKHNVFWLWGAESARLGQKYGEVPFTDYVSLLAKDLNAALETAPHKPALVGGHNEWNVDYYGNKDAVGKRLDQVRDVDNALYTVCKDHGVPYCLSSVLAHDWTGGNPGWRDFQMLYPPGEKLPGDFIDLHVYAGNVASAHVILLDFLWQEDRLPVFLGEIGTVPKDFPIRGMFQLLLMQKERAAAACWFSAQDGSDNPEDSSYGRGLWDAGGNVRLAPKSEYDAVARERADDKYIIGGIPPVPEPNPIDNPYPVELGFADYQREHFEEVGLAIGRMCYLDGHDGHGGANTINMQPFDKGQLWWIKDSNEIRFSPFSAAS